MPTLLWLPIRMNAAPKFLGAYFEQAIAAPLPIPNALTLPLASIMQRKGRIVRRSLPRLEEVQNALTATGQQPAT